MHVSVVTSVTEHTRGVRPNHQVKRLALSVSCECAANDGVSMKLLPHTAISSIMTNHVCLGIALWRGALWVGMMTSMQNGISSAKAYARVHEQMRIDYI
jgi:outer membrane receptor for monomeric catechols